MFRCFDVSGHARKQDFNSYLPSGLQCSKLGALDAVFVVL